MRCFVFFSGCSNLVLFFIGLHCLLYNRLWAYCLRLTFFFLFAFLNRSGRLLICTCMLFFFKTHHAFLIIMIVFFFCSPCFQHKSEWIYLHATCLPLTNASHLFFLVRWIMCCSSSSFQYYTVTPSTYQFLFFHYIQSILCPLSWYAYEKRHLLCLVAEPLFFWCQWNMCILMLLSRICCVFFCYFIK